MELGKGTVVDRYTIDSKLGQGGMATVYKARHNQLGTWHAIKVLLSPSPQVRERLLQEGRVQARMRHPNIVVVSDVIDVRGQLGLVMEYVEGVSLDQFMERMRLTPAQVDELARGILDAVAEAHRHGLVHRDLKPGNVLVQPRPGGVIPKVMDFGLVKDTIAEQTGGANKTRTNMIMGTACYMAPEQIKSSKKVDQRADVFALGAILYEMLSGQRAFPQEEVFDIWKAIDSGTYRPLGEVVADLPERMLATVARALQVDRELRFPDVPSMIDSWCGREARPSTGLALPSGPWDAAALDNLISRPSPETASDEGAGGPPGGGTWGQTRAETSEPTFFPDPEPPPDATSSSPTISNVTVRRALALGLGGAGLFGGVASLGAVILLGIGVWLLWPSSEPPADLPAPPVPIVAPAPPPAPVAPVLQPVEAPIPPPLPVPAPPPKPTPVATGKLQLRSTPWSKIRLDGRDADETGRWVRDLPAGPHKVRLTTADGRTKETTVQVVAGSTLAFCWNFDLERACD